MSKWCGMIGYVKSFEESPGIWVEDKITERKAYGDIVYYKRMNRSNNQVVSDIELSEKLSVFADPFIKSNYAYIRYAIIDGVKWCVLDVERNYPRLELTLGGVYNGGTTK